MRSAAACSVVVVTNDVFTREDAAILERRGVLPAERIVGVRTGCCPHTAIRDDISENLEAIADLEARFAPDLVLLESGGDNLTATFSRALVDVQLFVIDVAGGDKVPRKGGPGITSSDLLVINKTDLAPLVGADLDVMARDAAAQRGALPTVFTALRRRPAGHPGHDLVARATPRRPARVRAAAAIRAELVGGRTRLVALRSDPPLTVRATPVGRGRRACTSSGSAGGPLGGDELAISVEVGPGAALTVCSAAATLAQPGPDGEPRRSLNVTARVGEGGSLRWCPEPLVAVRGCDHHATTTIATWPPAPGWSGARSWSPAATARNPAACAPASGSTVTGGPLHRGELAIGQPGWDGPAGTTAPAPWARCSSSAGRRPSLAATPGVRASALAARRGRDARACPRGAARARCARFLDSVVSAGS